MNVNEIFGSIDGEGLRTGELATFIRLSGCNLRCSYCDTRYAMSYDSGTQMTIDEILKAVNDIGYKNVTVTGGEPLTQEGIFCLIQSLSDAGYLINIETNGSIDISPYQSIPNVTITMDYKTESSGFELYMLAHNFSVLKQNDVLKFVCSEDDLPGVKSVLKRFKPSCYVYLSPVFGKIEPYRLVDFLKEMHADGMDVSKSRVQLQLHKYIWNPDERGV